MTFEVQQTRWDRIIRRASGSIGPGSRVSETLSELFPVLDVERVPGELLLLGGTQIAMGQLDLTPLAANFPQIMLRNSGGSGSIITITQVRVSSTTAQRCRFGPTLNTFTVNGLQTIRDTRRGPVGTPVGRVLGDRLLVKGPNFFTAQLNGTDDVVLEDPNGVAVVVPGTAFSVSANVVNTDLVCSFLWRERPAEESELSLE